MGDSRTHRGPHPKDRELFAEDQLPALSAAVTDYSWLQGRGYAQDSALKLVGDRYQLTARQRTAVGRCACSAGERENRRSRRVKPEAVRGGELWLDGFNVLTTVESALGGGVLLRARDGCTRDMASMHGSYRMMEDTREALGLISEALGNLEPSGVTWLLDQPVSNSGRLKAVIAEVMEDASFALDIRLVPDPDPVLMEAPEGVLVATADSGILDACGRWFDLVGHLLRTSPRLSSVWLLNPAEE